MSTTKHPLVGLVITAVILVAVAAFVAPSFGVYEEAPVDVVWRFSAEAAPIARQFQFHPSQTIEACADGTLVVHFHAGGLLEMAWHLMTWGQHVEVLEPAALRDHQRQRRILRARDRDGAGKAVAATDDEFVHDSALAKSAFRATRRGRFPINH